MANQAERRRVFQAGATLGFDKESLLNLIREIGMFAVKKLLELLMEARQQPATAGINNFAQLIDRHKPDLAAAMQMMHVKAQFGPDDHMDEDDEEGLDDETNNLGSTVPVQPGERPPAHQPGLRPAGIPATQQPTHQPPTRQPPTRQPPQRAASPDEVTRAQQRPAPDTGRPAG